MHPDKLIFGQIWRSFWQNMSTGPCFGSCHVWDSAVGHKKNARRDKSTPQSQHRFILDSIIKSAADRIQLPETHEVGGTDPNVAAIGQKHAPGWMRGRRLCQHSTVTGAPSLNPNFSAARGKSCAPSICPASWPRCPDAEAVPFCGKLCRQHAKSDNPFF